MNEIKKQLLSKMGDTSEQKDRVIKRVNDSLNSKPKTEKKIPWGYYITFASFVGIFIVGLLILPNLMNEQSALNEEDSTIVDPLTEETHEKGYYDELKQIFPPDGTVATFKDGDNYSVVETYWLSDRYVQEIHNTKDCESCIASDKPFVKVFRITEEEIQQVYGGEQLEWTTEALDRRPSLGVVLKGPIEVGTEFGVHQQIVSIDAELSTSYGAFSNVVVVEGGADPTTKVLHHINYYVPNYGLVKFDTEGFGHYELVSISFGKEISQEDDYSDLLKSYYFPSSNIQYNYSGGFEAMGMTVHTYWLSDQYVQKVSGHKDFGITEQIYRINGNQIDLIFAGMIDSFKPMNWTIEQLNEFTNIQTVLKAPFNIGDEYIYPYGEKWTIVETDGKVSTSNYGEFDHVLVLESIDEEQGIRTKQYLAKGYGEVKTEMEFFVEETGQYETIGMITELESISQIMFELEQNEQSIFNVYEADQYNDIDLDSDWELSPDGTKRAALIGRARDFEGINVLVIEDLETNKFTIFKYRDVVKQHTPKELEWIDEDQLYVIVGQAYGTVTKGGQLYVLNINDYSTKEVFEDLTSKEEIMSIEKNNDGTFTYQKYIYEDDNFSVGRVEEGILSPAE